MQCHLMLLLFAYLSFYFALLLLSFFFFLSSIVTNTINDVVYPTFFLCDYIHRSQAIAFALSRSITFG